MLFCPIDHTIPSKELFNIHINVYENAHIQLSDSIELLYGEGQG